MKELFQLIPEKYFVDHLKKNTLGNIKIAIAREIIGNAIIRSNYPDETTTFKLSPMKDVVEVPARKLKSREKLLGLKVCRQFDAVDSSLRYNVIKKSEHLANPNSILFGDSVTESGDAIALSSRAIYDWAYSIRDVNEITGTLQHNALSEGGTMWNEEEGKLRQSLFQVQYVKPGTILPHFITVENVTPELFLHLMICVLHESRYFAQSTTTSAANMKNHIVGVGFGDFEQPINSYTLASGWKADREVSLETVTSTMRQAMEATYGTQLVSGADLSQWVDSTWEDSEGMQAHYRKAKEDCLQYLSDIGVKTDKK